MVSAAFLVFAAIGNAAVPAIQRANLDIMLNSSAL